MGEKLRIYIGGLGSNVQEDDLRKTFTSPQLGTVDSVEIIRTKGRSFGYLEFVPASDKGLAKLFSTYNGCMWKGGRLKLEKAKEDYLVRLRREWEQDAELKIKSSGQNVHANESVHVLHKPIKDQDIAKMQINLFFPKLRKIKPIPFKGTGKHKYSFQRVDVPPLPIHFCDCEEHSQPSEPAKRNISDHHEMDAYGVNEDELNMMKSILNKLLEKEDVSEAVFNEAELSEEVKEDISSADNLQVDDNEDGVSDEDNLVINIVGKPSKSDTSFEDWGRTSAANKDSLVREPESFSKPIPKIHGSNKPKLLPDKKRKQSIDGSYSNDIAPSKKKEKKEGLNHSVGGPVTVNTQPTDKDSRPNQSSCDVASSRKPAWRSLVTEKKNTAFHISDILANPNPDVEAEPRSDRSSPAPCENNDQEGQTNQDNESETLFECQSTKPSAIEDKSAQSTKPSSIEDKSARGPSWLQKSSWLQLVGDSNKSSFSIGQIIPGVTFEKQELPQGDSNDFTNSQNGEQQKFVHKDRKSPVEDIGKPQGGANKDIYASRNVDVLTNEQNHAGLDREQPDPNSKQTVEEKDEVSAPMHGTNLLQINRTVPDIVISDTCPFMKSAASMKEWMKTKAALSGSHKKNGKGKEPIRG